MLEYKLGIMWDLTILQKRWNAFGNSNRAVYALKEAKDRLSY